MNEWPKQQVCFFPALCLIDSINLVDHSHLEDTIASFGMRERGASTNMSLSSLPNILARSVSGFPVFPPRLFKSGEKKESDLKNGMFFHVRVNLIVHG